MKTLIQAEDGSKALLRGGVSQWPTIMDTVHDTSNAALLHYLDFLLADTSLLIEAAQRSHRHQLGFIKIVLLAEDTGACLRLHLWDRESVEKEDIHSHCADFSSRVMLGRLSENSYELTPGANYARFRYSFDTAMGCSVAVADGLTDVSLVASRVMLAGDIYTKRAFDLHNVSNVTQGTLTVSAWSTRNTEALVLKSDLEASARDCSAPIGMSESELRVTLCSIKERIIRR
ncbi:hypothetical protein [Pseudomonas sp. SHC52]|uniref:hypothetical protein n=1 Tax=Pseudomonas sp. SHC52 TaxID=984195 RepID=UPI0012ED8F4F|nr:hypothetical protein [Pseudomonas sp. SHC52]